jgi:hypothetical protein
MHVYFIITHKHASDPVAARSEVRTGLRRLQSRIEGWNSIEDMHIYLHIMHNYTLSFEATGFTTH